tara:strand:+ start:116 stop:712 length:597 start_codon:yes stop_codon:yes gene_type:complete
MSKKSNILVSDANLTNLHTNVKAIANKENGLVSANTTFVAWASKLYKDQKNVHLNFANPNTKKSNLNKDEYVIVLNTIAKAIFNKEDYKLYNCADITVMYGFKKKTASYKGKADKKRKLQMQPASRCNKLAATLEKMLTPAKKGGASRQGSKFDQIDKLFATLVTKINANADKLKFTEKNDLEVIKSFITKARSCISK